jgi:SNF2 family DNA or RNA helicase
MDPQVETIAFQLQSPYELSDLDYVRSIPGHMWIAATQSNIITLPYLSRLESRFEVEWSDEAKEIYQTWNDRPDYIVKLSTKKDRIEVIENKKQRESMFRYDHGISSLIFDYRSTYRIAIPDAHLLPGIQKNYKVEYSEEARKIIEDQLSRQKALLEIVEAKDYDGFNDLVNLPLKPDQRVALRFSELLNGRSIVAYDVGKGKSAIAIAESKRISNILGRPCKTLIVAPAQLKTNWLREIKKFTGEDAYILAGAAPDNISVDLLFKGKLNYYIINYDIIGRSQRDKSGEKILLWPKFINLANFDLIVYDEVHYAKNIDSQRSVGSRELKAPNVILLSGTLITNRPTDAYPPLSIVAPEVFNNYSYFISTWTYDGKTVRDEKAFRKMLSNYVIRRLRDPVEIERITNYVDLDSVQRAYYNKVLEGVYVSLSNPDYQRDVNGVLAEITRLKQICSSACVDTSAELAQNFIADSEEGKDKVIIFSQYLDSCYELSRILGSNTLLMTGDASNAQRYEMVDKFQNDPEVKIMIASTKTASEGLTLTKAHCVIFNDLMWTPASHIQAEGRAFGRVNDPHGGIVYTVVAQNTIMQMIQEILESKRHLIDETVDSVHREAAMNSSIVSEFLSKLRGMR